MKDERITDMVSTIDIQHGERFSGVILKNEEADIWCEVNRFEGNNRKEMADQVAIAIRYSIYAERKDCLTAGESDA